ncbi:hypothetical protein [Dictyobacter kobayashii]|uniref:Fucose-specific lectin n=1 Tax=Dictyobacter kobayashii TaxID=2014872 RepID=A0A402AP61_9CHLR|nr:hypothetical protein [Dictyobacter kobayashii]GCE20981.1 hypothetical protein KDK_47810 [Dictyobacter kobayashii]
MTHANGNRPAITMASSATTSTLIPPALHTLPVQGGAIAASQWSNAGTTQTVYIDANSHIQQLSSKDGRTWQQTDLTQLTHSAVSNGKALTSYSWDKGDSQQVAFIDTLGHVHVLWAGEDGHWQVLDITQQAHAPLANGVILVNYEAASDGSQHIVYIDQQKHIQDLASIDGITWQATDITKLTHAALADGTTLSAFVWSKDESNHIVYVDTAKHLQELSSSPDGNWQADDLTQQYGAPLSNGHVVVAYEWRVTGSIIIDYIDNQKNIQELSRSLATVWAVSNLTNLSNRPPASGQSLAGYDWEQGDLRVLIYVDENKHLQELSLPPYDRWQGTDLTLQAVTSLVSDSGLVGFGWSLQGTKEVVFVDVNQHVHELTGFSNGKWQSADWQ